MLTCVKSAAVVSSPAGSAAMVRSAVRRKGEAGRPIHSRILLFDDEGWW